MPAIPTMARGDAVILPVVDAARVINGTVRESAALSTFTQVPTTTKDSVVPVLNRDVEASWVSGDTGRKSVDTPQWTGQSLVAEDLAVLVPVPDNLIADQSFSLTDAMMPLFARAMARGIDRAALFGVNKPAGWESPSLLEAAAEVGNTVETGTDPAEDLLSAAELPSIQGYSVDRAIVRPGWQFAAARVRTHDLVANPAGAADPFPLTLAGLPLYLNPPAFDASAAAAFVIDSSCCLIGLRQDIAVTEHPDGVIADEDGKVLLSAAQQDVTIFRVVMRVGYLLAKPPTDAGLPAAERAPVAAVVPASGNSVSGQSASAHAASTRTTAKTKSALAGAVPRPHATPCPDHAQRWAHGTRGRATPCPADGTPRAHASSPATITAAPAARPPRTVDHIDRHGGDADANLQALCGSCHAAKTQAEAAAARQPAT